MNKNLLVVTLGGTTCTVNAILAGVVKASQESKNIGKILAGQFGMEGILSEKFVDLTFLINSKLTVLSRTPASGFIGTARMKIMDSEALLVLADVLSKYNIGYIVFIGGNGTIKQTIQLSKFFASEISTAFVPATIDNDVGDKEFDRVLYTSGFPSCVNYWKHKIEIMNQENLGACSHDKVLVIQTVGRKTGFLAGCARLGDIGRKIPLIILLPEDQKPLTEVLNYIKDVVQKNGRAIVVISEGYDIGDIGERYDSVNQIMYGSSRTTSAQLLINCCVDMNIQARGFIPGIDQRDEILLLLESDFQIALQCGKFVVKGFDEKRNRFMTSLSKDKEVCFTNLEENKNYFRTMPENWILKGEFDVTDEYIEYLNSFKIPRVYGLYHSSIWCERVLI